MTVSIELLWASTGEILPSISTFEIGGSESGEAFLGQITDFNVWNRTLTVDEIERFSFKCDQSLYLMSQPVVSWSNLSFGLNMTTTGPVTIKNAELEDLCKLLSPGTSIIKRFCCYFQTKI